jgi:hypothetical protein
MAELIDSMNFINRSSWETAYQRMLFPEPAAKQWKQLMAMNATMVREAYDYHGSTIKNRLSSILRILCLGQTMLQFHYAEHRTQCYG